MPSTRPPRFRLMRRYPTAAGVKTADIKTYQFGDVLIRFAPTAEHALELVRAMGIVGGVVALPCDENGRLLERSLEMAS